MQACKHANMQSYSDIPYINNHNDFNKFDLFVPLSAELPPPILVFFHGGSWRSGSRKKCTKWAESFCLDCKIAVAVPSYRLALKEPNDGDFQRYPAQRQDSLSAISYVIANPKGYDETKVYLAGHSAGAHIIFMLMLGDYLKQFESNIKGLVGLQGIYDLNALLDKCPSYSDFIEQAFGPRNRAVYALNSPQSLLLPHGAFLPRILIVHSPDDELVDTQQAVNFWQHMRNMYPEKLKQLVCFTADTQNKHFETLTESKTRLVINTFIVR